MGGTVRGSIEHYLTSGAQAGSRDVFVLLHNFFNAHPSWTRISAQYGASASGFDFTGGANPAGENAFAVFQNTGGAYTWFVIMQWSYNATLGSVPGNPGDAPQSYGTAIGMAYSTDESTVWNGGVGNSGADSKGSPVWSAATGNLVVHPRGNGSSGSFVTNKEAMAQFYSYGWSNYRIQIVGDDDFVFLAVDANSDADYEICMYMGPYTPVSGVSVTGPPLCMLQGPGNLPNNANMGTTSNGSATQEGGCVNAAGTSQSRIVRTVFPTAWFNAQHQPNNQRVPPSYDLVDIPVFLYDGEGVGTYGQLGSVNLVQAVYGPAVHSTISTRSKAIFGTSTSTMNWVVPWDGTTEPGTGTTRDGIQF